MLAVQAELSQKIAGFKFNLGYSGKGYKRGNADEDDGDEAVLEYAHRFTWFGHLYDHEQAHRFSLQDLLRSMKRNKKFAEVRCWLVCHCRLVMRFIQLIDTK